MKESQYEDDDRLFLSSRLPTLKSLPTHLKFAVRMAMMQCINKYIASSALSEPTQIPQTSAQ